MPRTIRFHLDEHCATAIAEGLRRRGIDVTTSRRPHGFPGGRSRCFSSRPWNSSVGLTLGSGGGGGWRGLGLGRGIDPVAVALEDRVELPVGVPLRGGLGGAEAEVVRVHEGDEVGDVGRLDLLQLLQGLQGVGVLRDLGQGGHPLEVVERLVAFGRGRD